MPSKILSGAIVGLDARVIEVEIETSYGLRYFEIVGLADKSVQESRERVGIAIKNSGFKSPHSQPQRVLVSLAPADLKKEGSLYDLPIALGYLLSSKNIKFSGENRMFLGELALDGRLRPIKGIISFSILCKENNISEIIVPKENAKEAGLIKGLRVIGASNLAEVIDYVTGKKDIAPEQVDIKTFLENPKYEIDLGHIKGQELSKRALEIAATGSHNLFMIGPPGTGKTLLAKAIPTILPPLSFEQALEVTKIYSIAGLLPPDKPLITRRQFRSPHHSASEVALIGGGNPPTAGEITLSHHGVLFLDEFPEFHRDVLESLRQPIEEKQITISRARHSLTLPTDFTLVAASNPCPCGYYKDPEKSCSCTNSQIHKYKRKLSGPLMDRVDLFITVPQIKYEKLVSLDQENSSQKARQRVHKARQIQKHRFGTDKPNSDIKINEIKKYCQVDSISQNLLKKYVDSGRLSARGYHRVLRVARTIADLAESESIRHEHVSESLMYRLHDSTV
jgi:magnesium chelatase family protein